MFVPANTPDDIKERLDAETRKALQEPDIRDKLARLGVDPMDMSTGQFARWLLKK